MIRIVCLHFHPKKRRCRASGPAPLSSGGLTGVRRIMRLTLLFMFMDFFFVPGMLVLMWAVFALLMLVLTSYALVLMFMEMLMLVFMLVRVSMLVAFFFLLLSMHMRMLVGMPMRVRMLVYMFTAHNQSSCFQANARLFN
jgi:hypothetical protein